MSLEAQLARGLTRRTAEAAYRDAKAKADAMATEALGPLAGGLGGAPGQAPGELGF